MSLSVCKKLYRAGELRCKVTSIGPEVDGFIYRSRSGRIYILVDDSISPEARARTLLHESHHATFDMKRGYAVGVDEHLSEREKMADREF